VTVTSISAWSRDLGRREILEVPQEHGRAIRLVEAEDELPQQLLRLRLLEQILRRRGAQSCGEASASRRFSRSRSRCRLRRTFRSTAASLGRTGRSRDGGDLRAAIQVSCTMSPGASAVPRAK
jgi:hypothetical protein